MGDERKPPTLKDVINIGLALATSAVELAEEKISKLVERGKLSAEEGKKVLGEPRIGAHGTLIFFMHPKDMGGVLTEIMEVAASGGH